MPIFLLERSDPDSKQLYWILIRIRPGQKFQVHDTPEKYHADYSIFIAIFPKKI